MFHLTTLVNYPNGSDVEIQSGDKFDLDTLLSNLHTQLTNQPEASSLVFTIVPIKEQP